MVRWASSGWTRISSLKETLVVLRLAAYLFASGILSLTFLLVTFPMNSAPVWVVYVSAFCFWYYLVAFGLSGALCVVWGFLSAWRKLSKK